MCPEISIVICTHNQARYLKETVLAVLNQSFPQAKYEVIVVDNGSNGVHCRGLESFDFDGSIVKIVEPRLGLSYARNTGWQHAKGKYVTFLDDDAVPEIDWLKKIWDCIERNPTIGVLGGAVLPQWSEPIPKWLELELYPAISVCNYDGPSDGFPLDFPRQYPVGANITYSRSMLMDLGGFDPSFGRIGNILLSGEETELNFRGKAAGWQIWFCPAAIVKHQIFPHRMRPGFFRTRYYWSGRTWARLDFSIFGKAYVMRTLLRKVVLGFSLDFARYFYFGWIKRRNPILMEVYYHELMGYVVQAIRLLSGTQPQLFIIYRVKG